MKRLVLFLLTAIMILSGCDAEPVETTETPWPTDFGWSLHDRNVAAGIEMEDFSDNLEYDYVKWYYSGWYSFSLTQAEKDQGLRPESWCSDYNQTQTAQKTRDTSDIRGCQILTCLEEYHAITDSIGATKSAALENCGAYQEPKEIQRTWEGSIDAAFFAEHDLILVDYWCEGNTFLRSRLDKVKKDRLGHVTVQISWETVYAYTADQPGEVYWIVMPKGCKDVTVEYTETAWN